MRTDRERQSDALDDIDRLPEDQQDGSVAILVRLITQTTYPTVAASVYACHAVSVDATDTEGTDPSFSEDASTVLYAVNVGNSIPDSGIYVIVSGAGGRLVFSFNG